MISGERQKPSADSGVSMLDIEAISANLTLGQDGIWYSKENVDISYPEDGNEACFSIEENSFWFKHRNECIVAAVRAFPPEENGWICDIGGGNGFVALALAAAGFEVALLEPGKTGASNAKRRGVDTVICATTDTAELKPDSLSAVGLFDVVEHIADDLAFLKSLRDVMKEQGRMYMTVPAFTCLWSSEDASAGHYRRYTRKSICEVVEAAGFSVEFCSYFFRFLPIPIMLFRVLPYRLGLALSKDKAKANVRDHAANGGLTSSVLTALLKPEIENLRKQQRMRFGGSCLVVATRA